jgi:hypothetical protein
MINHEQNAPPHNKWQRWKTSSNSRNIKMAGTIKHDDGEAQNTSRKFMPHMIAYAP